jgi:hypothetical protein
MCLQWCHVRRLLVDNDIPCALLCPDAIRLAQVEQHCRRCMHYQPAEIGLCLLTHEIIPLAGNCCHWNAAIEGGEVLLFLGENVPEALAAAHGVETTTQIFEMVESAPELPEDRPEEGLPMQIEELAVPLVYGVVAADWDRALYPLIP